MLEYQSQRMGFPLIFLFREKHGERLFIVNSLEEVKQACLVVALDRMNYYYPNYEKVLEKKPASPPENTRNLDMPEVQRAWRQFDADMSWWERSLHDAKLAADVAESQDPDKALDLIEARCDWEYETFELVKPFSLEID